MIPKLRFLYRAWKARARDQRTEITALTSALRPDEIAVDVGANKGSYVVALSRAVPAGRVIAFEPQPSLAEYLKLACARVGLANVVVEAAGVSNENGVLTLAIPGAGDPGASFEAAATAGKNCRMVQVPVHALDSYFTRETRRIGAIKIDVEGHELAVLQGAEHVLRTHHPLVVCECEARHRKDGSVTPVLDFFRSLSYDGFFVRQSRLVPLAEFDPAIHQPAEGDRFWDLPDYCNNFVMKRIG